MESQDAAAAAAVEDNLDSGVKLLHLELPEDEGEGLGFRLTRTLWDPYPWVREVSEGSRAAAAGLRAGHCILQADGTDLLGMPVGSVARVIRGDGAGRRVPLLAWHCGRDPSADPELLWSAGGGPAGERARRALDGVLRALRCSVCAATATAPRACRRDHLYCIACWSRLEKCALCREPLPPKESPLARNLVAEQVFEAIATEYEIKNVKKRPAESASACSSPNLSPNMSLRRGHYQISLMSRKKQVQFNEINKNYASDPNLHRSSEKSSTSAQNIAKSAQSSVPANISCVCRREGEKFGCACNAEDDISHSSSKDDNCQCAHSQRLENRAEVPRINIENADDTTSRIPHRVVRQLRAACSLADLQQGAAQACPHSRSLNDLPHHCNAHGSYDNIRSQCDKVCEAPVFLLSAPPVYVVTCDHGASN